MRDIKLLCKHNKCVSKTHIRQTGEVAVKSMCNTPPPFSSATFSSLIILDSRDRDSRMITQINDSKYNFGLMWRLWHRSMLDRRVISTFRRPRIRVRRPSPAINKRHIVNQWILFMTEIDDVTPKTNCPTNIYLQLATQRYRHEKAKNHVRDRALRPCKISRRSVASRRDKRIYCHVLYIFAASAICRHAEFVCLSVCPSVLHVHGFCRNE